jgi:hypothetical protein
MPASLPEVFESLIDYFGFADFCVDFSILGSLEDQGSLVIGGPFLTIR